VAYGTADPARNQCGWLQEALAEHAAMHLTYVGPVERGERNISLDQINALAAALQVTVADLFRARPPAH